jgi:hypothetical protein
VAVPLRIVRGDATSPQAKGPKLIAHIGNDLGGWGKGFVLAVSRRWPEPEQDHPSTTTISGWDGRPGSAAEAGGAG